MTTLLPQQRADLERDGFLILRGVLTAEEVAHYLEVVERLDASFRAEKGLDSFATVEIRNAIARDDALLPLLDHPQAFPLVAAILGWNIQLTTSHVFVRTPNPDEKPSFKAIDWHADGPTPPFPIVHGTFPRMYVKIGYFLTDLSEPGRGNLRVIPGSHLKAEKPPLDENGEPHEAVEILTRPGDAVLFENRCWHAVGPNFSPNSRKNIYLGYCHRYLKAIDFASQSEELGQKATPVQKQLLGFASNPLSFYLPGHYLDDVPLKEILEA